MNPHSNNFTQGVPAANGLWRQTGMLRRAFAFCFIASLALMPLLALSQEDENEGPQAAPPQADTPPAVNGAVSNPAAAQTAPPTATPPAPPATGQQGQPPGINMPSRMIRSGPPGVTAPGARSGGAAQMAAPPSLSQRPPSALTPRAALPSADRSNPSAALPAKPFPGLSTNFGTNITTEAGSYKFNFYLTPIPQVLEEYSKLVGRTILRADQGTAQLPDKATITLKTRDPLTLEEAIEALEVSLGMNGVTVVPMGDKFIKVVTETAAASMGGKPGTNDSTQIPEMGRYVTQIVSWKYASAQDIEGVLKYFARSQNGSIIILPSTQTMILRDYAENVKRMVEMLERIDQPTPLEITSEVIPIKYALASDIQQVLGSLGGGGGVSVGRSTAGGGLGSSGSRSTLGGSASASGGMSSSTQTGSTTGTTGGGGARTQFQNNLSSLVKQATGRAGAGGGDFQLLSSTKIIADERTNSLLIFANKQDLEMVRAIIAKLDVVLAQVLIEAIIMKVTLNDTASVGVSYMQNQTAFSSSKTIGGVNNNGSSGLSSGTNSIDNLTSGFSYLANIKSGKWNFDVAMTAVQTDDRLEILSRPRIQTSHAVPCSIFVGGTQPYITGTSSYYTGSGTSSQYTEKEIGIQLDVLPLINPDGLVVMDIRQNIEDTDGSVKIDNNDVPKTSKSTAEAKVAVRNGETIMLGGMIQTSKDKSHSGVPLLMDVPVLGYLFRSHSDTTTKKELIVLIRPTVLKTPEAAAVAASEAHDQMLGARQAELDIRKDERKSYEKIQSELNKEAEKNARDEKKNGKPNGAAPSPSIEPLSDWNPAPAPSPVIVPSTPSAPIPGGAPAMTNKPADH